MPFYRVDIPEGSTSFVHINFGRRRGPAPCVAHDAELGARCARVSEALCDYPVGRDLAGKTLTCDAPICRKHRARIRPNVDHCPRHGQQPLKEING